MGLALDELENTEEEILEEDNLKIIIDEKIKTFVSIGRVLTVDYINSHYGSGFIVNGGSTC